MTVWTPADSEALEILDRIGCTVGLLVFNIYLSIYCGGSWGPCALSSKTYYVLTGSLRSQKPLHSPSTRSLARPPRDALAARSRAPGRGSAHSPRPSRRVHANVQVEVLCAHNGTQHQPKHKSTPHASEQPISGSFPRAHTRRDPCGHGSPIVRARPAPHKPHEHHIAQLCTMCGVTCCWLPHTAAHLHVCDALREHGIAARHTRARAARANAARAAASQRRRFAAQRTPAAFSRRALPSKLATRLMND